MTLARSLPAALFTVLVSSAWLAGCGAPEGGAPADGASEEEMVASAAARLAGTYVGDAGMLARLELRVVESPGAKKAYRFTAEQRVQCVKAPCPTIALEGTWFANATVLALRPTKSRTLDTRYVLSGETLSLTDKASGAVVAELEKQTPRDAVIAAALESMGLGAMKVDIDMSEVEAQQKAFPGKVSFDAALRAALESFVHDGDDPESPLGLVEGYDDPELCGGGTHQAQLMCLMNDASTTLGLVHRGESAEHGEEPKDAWIFTLSLDKLSDHGHWAVVDRAGVEATYNYGFN